MALGTPAAGTFDYSTAGGVSVAPSYPASVASTDALILLVGQKPATANGGGVTTPTGWTLRASKLAAGGYGATLGVDTGNTNLYVYTKDSVTGTETGSLSVTLSDNDVSWGAIVRVPSGGGALSFGATTGEDTTGDATLSMTGAGDPGFNTGDLAIYAFCIASDGASLSAGSIAATGATFGSASSLGIPTTSAGNDIRGIICRANCTAGASSGVPTATVAVTGTVTNARGPGVVLRVREDTTHATSGALTGQIGSVAGSAARTRVHAVTGVLASTGSAVIGSASRTAAPISHAAIGDLVGPDAGIAGSASRTRIHATTGVLEGAGAILAGEARRYLEFTSSGTLGGPGSELSGFAAHTPNHASEGALTGSGAELSGSARRFGWSGVQPMSETWLPVDSAPETWTPVSPATGTWN